MKRLYLQNKEERNGGIQDESTCYVSFTYTGGILLRIMPVYQCI